MVTNYNKFFGDPQISIEIQLVKNIEQKQLLSMLKCPDLYSCPDETVVPG